MSAGGMPLELFLWGQGLLKALLEGAGDLVSWL